MAARLLAVIAFALVFALHAGAAEFEARVTHIVDGDTLDLLVDGGRVRVRLLEIDAPEGGQAYGHRSRQSLIAVCGGELARVGSKGKDRNGRMLAYVRCNGTDAGAEQVRRGMAWVFVRYVRGNSPLYAIQDEARAARRGLWAESQPLPPWEWRNARRAREQ